MSLRNKKRMIEADIKSYCEDFLIYKNKIVAELSDFGLKLKLGPSLLGKSIAFKCLASLKNSSVLIEFSKSDKYVFNLDFVNDENVFKYYISPPYTSYESRLVISVNYLNIGDDNPQNSFVLEDTYPSFPGFERVILKNFIINDSIKKISHTIQFGLLKKGIRKKDNREEVRLILVQEHRNKPTEIERLERLSLVFKTLIENSDTKELEIDNFLSNNPLILQVTLNVDNLKTQFLLKDINDQYGQDLKPDALGYDVLKMQWKIIDYKRANKEIIKSKGSVRVSFKSEIESLKAQLKTYKEYFGDYNSRTIFKEMYGFDVKYPSCIGIIGFVAERDRDDFNKLKEDLPSWLEIFPYNDLLKYLEGYIQKLKPTSK